MNIIRRVLVAPFIFAFSIAVAIVLGLVFVSIWKVIGRYDPGFTVENGQPSIVAVYPILDRRVRPIQGADAATFRALESAPGAQAIYAVDAGRAYIGYLNHVMPIKSADPATFSIITPDGAFTVDKQRVYWFGVEIEGADPATFKPLKRPYAIDAKRAYVGTTPLEVNSLRDFEVVRVHISSRPIENSSGKLIARDPSKVRVSGWSRDGMFYYFGSKKLPNADYNSMEILGVNYAKDKDNVYYQSTMIPDADAASFEAEEYVGRDKDYEYDRDKRVGPRKG